MNVSVGPVLPVDGSEVVVARVLDKHGVLLTTGQRVEKDGRVGKVVGTLGKWEVLVLWDGERDDVRESAITLTTVDVVHETRRRRL